jgi:ABC-type amino acid transport substrate-binding protein
LQLRPALPVPIKRWIGLISKPQWLAISAATVLVGCAWAFFYHPIAHPPARVYTIGFQNSPPRQFIDPNGRPYGSVIDILNEAARRAGVQLRWVKVQEGPDRGLGDGIVDLCEFPASVRDAS